MGFLLFLNQIQRKPSQAPHLHAVTNARIERAIAVIRNCANLEPL